MSPDEQEIGSLGRAALRVEWASRALRGASEDLRAAGAGAAAEVIAGEAEGVERLGVEVSRLAKVRA
jgi:hypothetical protein